MPQRGIETGLWDHPTFEEFSPGAKLLFIYLVTSSKGNQAGLYRISLKSMAQHTGISQSDLPRLLKEIEVMSIVYYEERQVVWVKNFLKHQAHSPQFLKSVAKCLERMNDHDQVLVDEYLKYNQYGIDTVSIPYRYNTDTDTDTRSVTDKGRGIQRGRGGAKGGKAKGSDYYLNGKYGKAVKH